MSSYHCGTQKNKETKGPSCLGGTFLRDSAYLGLGTQPMGNEALDREALAIGSLSGKAKATAKEALADQVLASQVVSSAPLRPFYFHDLPVTVEDMGASREAYQDAVAAALQEADLLLTYRLNVPGPWKKSPLLTWAFDSLGEDLHHLLSFLTSRPPCLVFLGERRVVSRGGDLGILLLQAPGGKKAAPQVKALASQVKQILQAWEEGLDLAYLPDVDVYYREEEGGSYAVCKIFRTSLGAKPRPCFVCQDRTGLCLRKRRHSVALMEATLFADLFALFLHSEEQNLAALATSALIQEVALSPKPGLVSGANPGIHTDMDLEAMAQSISLFGPYFSHAVALAGRGACALLIELEGPVEARMPGFQDQGEAYSQMSYLLDQLPPPWTKNTQDPAYEVAFDRILNACFQDLRRQGLQLQRSMGQRTGGANTLFGQIFTMGLMVFAVGFLAALYMSRGRWAWELLPASHRKSDASPLLGARSEEAKILQDLSALVALVSRPVRDDELRPFFYNLHAYLSAYVSAPNLMADQGLTHPAAPHQLPPAYEDLQEKLSFLLTQEGPLCYKDLENIYHKDLIRLLGARAGALYGLPTVLEVGLPSLHEARRASSDRVTILSYSLLRLMAADGDTCALKRNPGYYFHLQETLPAKLDDLLQDASPSPDPALKEGTPAFNQGTKVFNEDVPVSHKGTLTSKQGTHPFEEGIRALMADLASEAKDQGYSPGGAADHLAQTIFASDALEHLSQIRALHRIPALHRFSAQSLDSSAGSITESIVESISEPSFESSQKSPQELPQELSQESKSVPHLVPACKGDAHA